MNPLTRSHAIKFIRHRTVSIPNFPLNVCHTILCPFITSNLYTKPPLISNRSATAARSLFKPQIDHTITFAFVSISMPYRFLFRARHNISRFRLTSNLSTYECISVKHNSQKRAPRRSEYRKFKPSRSWMSSRSDLRIKYSHMMGSNNVHHDPNVGTTHTHIYLPRNV